MAINTLSAELYKMVFKKLFSVIDNTGEVDFVDRQLISKCNNGISFIRR